MSIEERLAEITGINEIETKDIPSVAGEKCYHYKRPYGYKNTMITDNYIIYLTKSILNAYQNFSMKDFNSGFYKFQSDLLRDIFFSYDDDDRWNIYLYIVYEDEKILADVPVEKIELDDNYALKSFVNISNDRDTASLITDKWLSEIIPGIKAPSDEADITSVWESKLSKVGLAGFLEEDKISDDDVKGYIERNEEKKLEHVITHSNTKKSAKSFDKIRNLSFSGYRTFCFGTDSYSLSPAKMNILYGLNGSGKTSTLEAISAAFTGNGMDSGKATVISANDTSLSSDEVNASEYGKLWYNATIIRSSQLNNNFKMFNYFDNDRPYTFARGKTDDYNKLLANLFYDDETRRKQDSIHKLTDKFNSAQKLYNKKIEKLTADITYLTTQKEELQKSTNLSQTNTELVSAIKNTSYVFPIDSDGVDNIAANAIIASQACKELINMSKPYLNRCEYISYNNINNELLSAKENLKKLQEIETQYSLLTDQKTILEKRKKETITYLSNIDSATENVERLQSLAAGFSIKNVSEITGLKKKYSDLLLVTNEANGIYKQCLGFNDYTLLRISEYESYKRQLESTKKDFSSAVEKMNEQQSKIDEFEKEEGYIDSLKSNIHEMGIKFVSKRSTTYCPLCGAEYNTAELLLKAMQESANSLADSTNGNYAETKQSFIETKNNIIIMKNQITEITKKLQYLDLLVKLRNTLIQANYNATFDTLIDINIDFDNQLKQITEKHQTAIEIENLYNDISRSTIFLNYKNMATDISISDFLIYLKSVIDNLHNSLTEIVSGENGLGQIDGRVKQIEEKMPADGIAGIINQKGHYFQESELLKQTLDSINVAKNKFSINTDSNLLQWIGKLDSLANELTAFKKILADNNEIKNIEDTFTKRNDEVKINKQYSDRCQKVLDVLNDLPTTSKYAAEFIKANEKSITKLFTLIHRPREFDRVGFNENGAPILIRKGNSDEVKPSNMSTGQKTSFALAVMIALYLSAKSAPRVLLLDEPVVNMDEMHFSNLIEILRELVLNGTQIFITTENKEILGYLKRKFSFMNEDLHIYEFNRDVSRQKVEIIQLFPFDESETGEPVEKTVSNY